MQSAHFDNEFRKFAVLLQYVAATLLQQKGPLVEKQVDHVLFRSYAKRKDPPVSSRRVFLRSEPFRSAQDPIRRHRSNAINAVQYVLLYAGRTGRQLCFAATQQKGVLPVGSRPFAAGCASSSFSFSH